MMKCMSSKSRCAAADDETSLSTCSHGWQRSARAIRRAVTAVPSVAKSQANFDKDAYTGQLIAASQVSLYVELALGSYKCCQVCWRMLHRTGRRA